MPNQENEVLRETYKTKTPSDPPLPWRNVHCFVSGVTAIGFGKNTELLLVLTHSGLGVIDCTSGETLERLVEVDDYVEDPYPMFAQGIGPLGGQLVSLAGLWGGGLRTMTVDGWVIHRASPNWPTDSAILCTPDAPDLYDDPATATVLVKDQDPGIRAYGFSDTGQSLVVATTSLFIWTRT